MKHFATILLFISLCAGATAQETLHYSLRGHVEDAKSHEEMPFTNVALLRVEDSVFMRGATTDIEGNYLIPDVAEGRYLLKASFSGYEPYWELITITGNGEHALISLMPTTAVLQGVTVTAKRPVFSMDGEKNLYNVSEDPSVQSGTAVDALRSAPGVDVDMAGNVTLRGVASVDIWINGKPCHLDAEGLKQYLKTLPADAIDRIEVISNPSARYSSKGGVINLVTNAKIQKNDFLNLAAFGNTDPMFVPHFSYVHGGDKGHFNIYAGPKFTNTKSHSEYKSVSKDDQGNMAEEFTQTSDEKDRGYGYFVGVDFDYEIDTNSNISGWGGIFGGHGLTDRSGSQMRHLLGAGIDTTLIYTQSNHHQYKTPGYWAGLSYDRRFKGEGHRLEVNLNAGGYYVKPWKQDECYAVLDRSFEDFYYQIGSVSLNNNIDLEANYVRPLSKNGTLEMGAAWGYDITSDDYSTDTVNRISGAMANHPLFTYNRALSQHLVNGYATYQHRWGMFTAKVGLRAEEKMNHIDYANEPAFSKDYNYFDVMPSIHLTYSTMKMDNFKLNYTRRFNAPNAVQLDSRRIYNLESFSVGNPALLTSYTHNVEAGWTKFVPKFGYFSVEAYYHGNTNEMNQLSDVIYDANFGRLINYSKPVNMGNSSTLGAQANITYRPNAFVTLNLEGHVFDNKYRALYRENEQPAEDEQISWNVSLRGFVKVWQKVDLFCNISHTSPTIGLFTKNGAVDDMTLGFSADLLDHHLTIFAGVNDPFNWKSSVVDSNNPYYNYYSNTKVKSRNIMAGLNLRFGKMELESKAKSGQGGPQM